MKPAFGMAVAAIAGSTIGLLLGHVGAQTIGLLALMILVTAAAILPDKF